MPKTRKGSGNGSASIGRNGTKRIILAKYQDSRVSPFWGNELRLMLASGVSWKVLGPRIMEALVASAVEEDLQALWC